MKELLLTCLACLLLASCATGDGVERRAAEGQAPYAGALEAAPDEGVSANAEVQASGGMRGAEAGGGEMELEADAGRGTVFYVYLAAGILLVLVLAWLVWRKRQHRADLPYVRLR